MPARRDPARARWGANAAGLDDVDRVIAACVRQDRAELDRRLAAVPDLPGRYRYTDHLMLGWAIRRRLFAAVPLLLAAGLDPDVADPDGDTPLHLAAASGDPATIAALLAGGERGTHRSARALAEAGLPLDNLLLAAAANRVDTLADLLAAGADVNERHRDGYTALHAAAVLGHAEAVVFLLDRGADPLVRESAHGATPAGKARWRGHHDVAALIEARAAG